MRKGFVVVRVAPGEWLDALLPGLQVRADEGAVVQVKPERVVIDKHLQKEYAKNRAGEEGGR